MNTLIRGFLVIGFLALAAGPARADDYADTVALFKNAGQSASFFSKSYGYALFPTVGKGGLVKDEAARVGGSTQQEMKW